MYPLILFLCILCIGIIILIFIFRPKPNNNLFALSFKLDELFSKLDKITLNLKEDFRTNREEIATASKENRTELSDTLLKFKMEMNETLRLITEQNRSGTEQIDKEIAG